MLIPEPGNHKAPKWLLGEERTQVLIKDTQLTAEKHKRNNGPLSGHLETQYYNCALE